MLSIILIALALIVLSAVFVSKMIDLVDDRNYDPKNYECPACHKGLSFDEWDGSYCDGCGWDDATDQVDRLRAEGNHAAADFIEGLNTVAGHYYMHPDTNTDPQAYCRCGSHVNSVRCFTPNITNDEEVSF